TTSGAACSTAPRTAAASKASARTGAAPSVRSASAWERVIPTTSCPLCSSCCTSGRPIAPLAPARNIFIAWRHLLRLDAPRGAGQRRQDQGDRGQGEEVEPADQVARGLADVDEVVDRVDRVLDRREHQHRRPPAAAAHRDEEDNTERDVEGRDVLDVVVVLGGELAEAVVERARR